MTPAQLMPLRAAAVRAGLSGLGGFSLSKLLGKVGKYVPAITAAASGNWMSAAGALPVRSSSGPVLSPPIVMQAGPSPSGPSPVPSSGGIDGKTLAIVGGAAVLLLVVVMMQRRR